jgi:hypothetical protein
MILFEQTPEELERMRETKFQEKAKNFSEEEKELYEIVKGITISFYGILHDKKLVDKKVGDMSVELVVEDVINFYDDKKICMWKDRIEELQTMRKCKFVEDLK